MSDELTHSNGTHSTNSPDGDLDSSSGLSPESRAKMLRWFNGNPFDFRDGSLSHALRAIAWCEENSDIDYLAPEVRRNALSEAAKMLGLSTKRLSNLLVTLERPFEKRNKPYLIAFEGIDGAGKTHQLGLLDRHLRRLKAVVTKRSCPSYREFFGRELAKLLSGKETVHAANLDPKSMALWYALDRKQ